VTLSWLKIKSKKMTKKIPMLAAIFLLYSLPFLAAPAVPRQIDKDAHFIITMLRDTRPIKSPDIETVRNFLNNDGSPNITDGNGNSLIYLAAKRLKKAKDTDQGNILFIISLLALKGADEEEIKKGESLFYRWEDKKENFKKAVKKGRPAYK
jgi:hypothetical protein